MTAYTVTCYSPPAALKIADGNLLEIEGWQVAKKIRATKIRNLSLAASPTCNCNPPPTAKALEVRKPTQVRIQGIASKIVVDSDYVQFELTVQ